MGPRRPIFHTVVLLQFSDYRNGTSFYPLEFLPSLLESTFFLLHFNPHLHGRYIQWKFEVGKIMNFCLTSSNRPSAPRRSALRANMVPDTVLRSVKWSRKWKSPSTPSIHAASVARTQWGGRVLVSGTASDVEGLLLEVPGCTLQQLQPLSALRYVVWGKWKSSKMLVQHLGHGLEINLMTVIN